MAAGDIRKIATAECMFQLLMLRAGLLVGIAVLTRSAVYVRKRHSIRSSYMTATGSPGKHLSSLDG